MILLLLYVFFALLWIKGNKVLSLVFFYASITNGFNLKILATNYDLSYLSFAAGSFAVFSYIRNRNLNILSFSVENSVVWLYIFVGVHAFFTLFLEIDSPKYAFAVFRQWGLISIFLLFRKLSVSDIDKTLKFLLVINFVWLVLYYLQFVGLDIFVEERFKTAFKRNTPALSMFFAVYVFFMLNNNVKWILMLLFAFTSISAGWRGSFVGFVGALFAYYAIIKKSKKLLLFGVVVLVCQTFIVDFFQSETFSRNGKMSFIDEVKNGFNLDYKRFHGVILDGTFAYRTLYLYERFDYLLNNPKNMLFGIGSICEASPNNHMHFYIQDSGKIETDDLFWAAPLLRYGFFGISLYFLFFASYFLFFVRHKQDDKMVNIGIVFFMMLFITSIENWSFAVPANIMAMGMCYYRVKNAANDVIKVENNA